MDADAFDGLSRSVSRLLSRRALTAALGLAALGGWQAAGAKKKKKGGKKRRKKGNRGGNEPPVVFNELGCVDVGRFCQNSAQCCSGICTGAVCQAHDAADCVAEQQPQPAICGGSNVPCLLPDNPDGLCSTTTGKAAYCMHQLECFACTKDADCIGLCGPTAACIVCANCPETGNIACARATLGTCG
jgi:hypothetical protein